MQQSIQPRKFQNSDNSASVTMFVPADDILQGLAPFADDRFPVGQRGICFIRFLVGRRGERVTKFGARFVGRWRWFHFCQTIEPLIPHSTRSTRHSIALDVFYLFSFESNSIRSRDWSQNRQKRAMRVTIVFCFRCVCPFAHERLD